MMDYLRSSVNLRAYGQRDPLVEYKKEGLKLFKEMEDNIESTIAENLKKLSEFGDVSSEQKNIENQALKITGDNSPQPSLTTREGEKKIGRNDPCWCGSGKKFKRCHGLT